MNMHFFRTTKRTCSIFLILSVFAITSAFAKGEIAQKKVENKESWKESIEISNLKKGKYNVFVTAEDQSGNKSVEGPHNIFVDPESDLPVADISNPRENMHVPGNLNIVGTCVDDDSVKRVEIVLDDDYDNIIVAEGKEYWSYFLDTTNMEEGEHSITVYGVDENDTVGNSRTIKWHLDRKQPKVTIDDNHQMGDRVSGTIKLSGNVTDGNGISRLMYSLDNGEHYKDIPFKSNKDATFCEFAFTIDTTKLADGGQICYFKTSDKQGSIGFTSFLFFVDNTKPEVSVVYPPVGEVVNGIFTAAGYAKDVMGIQNLKWEFNGQSGDFELIPGNPYWALELDARSFSGKSAPLVITATDNVGNITSVKHTISIDQSSDKSNVRIESPVEGSSVGTVLKSDLFLRGIATDDDGIKKVTFVLDSNQPVDVECDGVFCIDVLAALRDAGVEPHLSVGTHSLKIWATDINDVVGNTSSVKFTVGGDAPAFANRITNGGKGKADEAYVPGVELNVQNGPVYKGEVESGNGIKSVSYSFEGKNEIVLSSNVNKTKYSFQIPIKDCPYGFCQLKIKATDVYDQSTEDVVFFYVDDLTVTRPAELYKPQVIFTDNRVDETGVIDVSSSKIVSGYFVGGKASSVRFEPATNFANISLSGNSIVLAKGNGQGVSDPVSIVVKSSRGIEYRTSPFVLRAATPEPKINFSGASGSPVVFDGFEDVTISGNVVCASSSNAKNSLTTTEVKYRVFSGKNKSEWITASENSASFSVTLPTDSILDGITVVEFLATDSLGQQGSNAVFINKVRPLAEGEKKAAPVVNWIEGENFYYTAFYRDALTFGGVKINGEEASGYDNPICGIVYRNSLNFGVNSLEVSVNDETEKPYVASYTAKRQSTISASIDKIDDKKYLSGMELELEANAPATVSVLVECPVAVSTIKYSFSGQGEKSISSKAIQNVGENLYSASFQISSGEYKTHDLLLTAVASDGTSTSLKGTVSIVQSKKIVVPAPPAPAAEPVAEGEEAAEVPPAPTTMTVDRLVNNAEKIYWAMPSIGSVKTGQSILGYANVPAPIKASISGSSSGLSIRTEGNAIIVTSEKSGVYSNVSVSVVDAEGVSHNAPALSFSSDSVGPAVKINAPANNAWVKNKIDLSGVASDDMALAKIEYSVDGRQTWVSLGTNASFSQSIDISAFEDGLVGLDVRAVDKAGNEEYAHISVHKKVSAPQVEVLVPCEEDVINGTNLLVFKLENAGSIDKVLYGGDAKKSLPFAPYFSVLVGTPDYPVAKDMSFLFTDKSGNQTLVKDWKFNVDNKSDLPVSEIHVPAEGEAITDDFVISGVVIDDDGACHIFYKIDNGNYIQLDGWENRFSIPFSIKDLTDNEHTISVYGTDSNGVAGSVMVRTFKVSLEEPKGVIEKPSFETTVKDRITISGTASDKNGIKLVQVSMDNGNTWNDAVGGTNWHYDLDTRVINDGTHTVFIRIFDNCGIQAIYSNLINIDNRKPEIRMELPVDGTVVSKNIFVSGYTADNIKITKLSLRIISLDSKNTVPSNLAKMELESEGIITKTIDISSLANGFYDVELVGEDAAGNVTRVSRNVEVNKKSDVSRVDILTPFGGSHISGEFYISGYAESEMQFEKLQLIIDGTPAGEMELSPTGYFKFEVPGTKNLSGDFFKKIVEGAKEKKAKKPKAEKKAKTEEVEAEAAEEEVVGEEVAEEEPAPEPEVPRFADGVHKFVVKAFLADGTSVTSPEVNIDYSFAGPWLRIDNFDLGDFAMQRPKVTGTVGYNLPEEEDKIFRSNFAGVSKEQRLEIQSKSVEKVEISWDNGQTFEVLSKTRNWKFRIENEYLQDGYHFVILKATFKNGEIVAQRLLIQVDNRKPQIRLISPVPLGHYNKEVVFSGLSSDETKLKDVSITMRKGDKMRYEMPSIFQGLYMDAHAFGATAYDVGVGVSFFNNNVKLQAQFGQMTDEMYDVMCKLYHTENGGMRYGGNVYGVKLMANVFDFPFKYWFGPDWEWLGMSLAIGADFSVFDKTQAGRPQVLSAMIAQLEFPRMTIPQQKYFRTFAFYTEYQLWFIPSDIDDVTVKSIVHQVATGLRIYVF